MDDENPKDNQIFLPGKERGQNMKISDYQKARYPFLWLQTTEEERTIRAHRAQVKAEVTIFSWDIAQGFSELTPNGKPGAWTWKNLQGDEPTTNPGQALQEILTMPEGAIYYLKDFHRFFKDPVVIRKALNIKETLKSTARLVCFLSSEGAAEIPNELKNDISPFSPPLPDREELKATVTRIASDNNIKEPAGPELDTLANSLIGLTEESAENALALCLVREKKFNALTLIREKARLIEGAGLKYQEYNESFSDLAGLENVKDYILRAAPSEYSSAALFYGIPGTGKSHLAKALANALKWPCIEFDLSRVRSKYQGESEGNLDKALDTIEAIGRAIVFVDEVDKAIGGVTGGADSDGGAGLRILGRLLRYFADRKPGGPYWIFTANSLTDILTVSGGAMVRRFDAMFFLDMPTAKERAAIIKIWNSKKGVDIPAGFDTAGFTGADIAKLAAQMKMLNVSADQARKYVIPTAQALGPRIDEIRKAARTTCIPASNPEEPHAQATGRKIDL
jgi:SpoVK/Ycf46/Vps4 family AAA+-type ATPase